MKRLSLLIFLAGASPALGEVVTVRSGEHPNFVRLVLGIPEDVEWGISVAENGFSAQFGEPVAEVDVGAIFGRIPRSRLANVTAEGTRMDMEVACDCYIDAYLYQPGMLVIDIIDGPAPADASFVPTAMLDDTVAPTGAPILGAVAEGEEPMALPDLLPTNTPDLTTQRPVVAPITLPLFTNSDPWLDVVSVIPPSFAPLVQRDPNLVEAERAIIESFARAATQGIFDFPARPLPPPPTEDAPARPNPIAPMTDPMDGIPIPLADTDPASPGILLRTGLDRVALEGEDDAGTLRSCPAGLDVDLNSWGHPDEYATLIAQLRLDASNDAGRTQPEALIKLAKAYVFYGFGAEARQVLATLNQAEEQVQFLTAISRLVDGDPIPVSDILPFRSCGTFMEAWITLATGRLDASDERVRSAVIMAYRSLPDTLRGHLGLRLAQIFAQEGELFVAQDILAGSILSTTGTGREAEIVGADLAGRTEGAAAEIARLDNFIENSPRAEPGDMVRLLDLARQETADFDDDILAIAETMRFEADGNASVADLVEAEVRLLISRGEPLAALALLDGDTGPMTEGREAVLRTQTLVSIAEVLDDDTFLPFAFSPFPRGTGFTAEHAVASRLIDLGFPSEAFVMVATPLTGEGREERRELQARAMRALGGADALVSLPTPLSRDDFAQLEQATLAADDGLEPPIEGSWRDGAWQALEQSDDPLLSSASRALLSPLAPVGNDTPLADSRALLSAAQETRDLTNDLLTRFVAPDTAE